MKHSKFLAAFACALFVLPAGAEPKVAAPPKASLVFKEAPARRGPASDDSAQALPAASEPELPDSETEAGFCFVCEKLTVLKSKSLIEQSEDILKASQNEDTP